MPKVAASSGGKNNARARENGPRHPSEEAAERIERLAGLGMTAENICAVEKMSARDLYAHYRDALEHGRVRCHAKVGGKIYEAALEGQQWAAALYAARQMGWKETKVVEMASAAEIRQALVKLPDAELAALASSGAAESDEA